LLATGAVGEQANSSLAELQHSGRLQLKAWLEPQQAIVVKQQVILNIEVSSDTWFTAGTRIARLEVEDAVVLRRQSFAVNSTRRKGGKTFTVQLWSIALYPQRAGHFELPPLPLTLSVAGDAGRAIQGQLTTPALGFEVELPPGLQARQSWITGTDFRVEESYNRGLDALQPGDAVQRQITFVAENMAAMMLPELVAREQPGLAVYQKPSQLKDNNNRGAYQARRTESITYLIESPGRYRLPARTYYWWDLDTQTLQQATLAEQLLNASAGAATEEPLPTTAMPDRNPWLLPALLAGGASFTLLIGILWYRRRRQRAPAQSRSIASERQLQRQLQSALQQRDWQQLVQTLYLWLDSYGGDQFDGSIRDLLRQLQQPQWQHSLDQLMRAAYYSGNPAGNDIENFVRALSAELQQQQQSPWWRPAPVSLKLN
jgi:hypothetical protein